MLVLDVGGTRIESVKKLSVDTEMTVFNRIEKKRSRTYCVHGFLSIDRLNVFRQCKMEGNPTYILIS